MSSFQHLRVTVKKEIGTIVLNRPEVLNALNMTMVEELEAALVGLGDRVRVIGISGAGQSFCAGADLDYVEQAMAEPHKLRQFIEQIQAAFAAVEQVSVPVVASVHGYALAGGFELIQACDIVLAAEDAQLGDQHARFGLIPGGGGSQRLVRLIGRQRSSALLLTGDRLSGQQAAEWGLVYQAVPPDQLRARTEQLLNQLAERSLAGSGRIKRLVGSTLDTPKESNLKWEVAEFCDYMQTAWEPKEGLDAFRRRKTPRFRPPPDGK